MSQLTRDQLTLHVSSRSVLGLDIQAFVIDRQARNYSPRTIKFYRDELKHFSAFLSNGGIEDTVDITAKDLRNYLVQLAERRNAGAHERHICQPAQSVV